MSNRLFSNKSQDPTEATFKTVTRFFGVAFALWIVWALICLSALVGIIYVAWHFISKFW